MGFHTFRDLILNKPKKSGKCVLNSDQHQMILGALLESPNLVVADEAHEIKNQKSSISQAIVRIQCKSRIALTGSPLSNHLGEYFSLIDWIAPGYLGTRDEFKETYEVCSTALLNTLSISSCGMPCSTLS